MYLYVYIAYHKRMSEIGIFHVILTNSFFKFLLYPLSCR